MKRLLLANAASPANPGDYAILKASIKLLHDLYGNPQITVTTRTVSQKEIYERLGCRVVASYPNVEHLDGESGLGKILRIPKTLMHQDELREEIRASDAVFLLGGTYFYSYRKFSPGLTFWSHCIPAIWAKEMGKPLVLLSQSFGPFCSAVGRDLFKSVLSAADLILVRESVSKQFLKDNFSFAMDKTHIMPDLALYLDAKELTGENPPVSEQFTIGAGLRPWTAEGADHNRYIAVISDALAHLSREKNAAVKIICHVNRPKASESDAPISAKLKTLLEQKIGNKVELFVKEPYYLLSEIAGLYHSCDFYMGMRLHASLLNIILEKLNLHIGYQVQKSKGMLHDMGLEQLYYGSVQDVSSEDLFRKSMAIMDQGENLKSAMRESVTAVRAEIHDAGERLIKKVVL